MDTNTKSGQANGSGDSKGGAASGKDTPGASQGSRQSGSANSAQRQDGQGVEGGGKRARYDDTVEGKQARYDSGRNRGGD